MKGLFCSLAIRLRFIFLWLLTCHPKITLQNLSDLYGKPFFVNFVMFILMEKNHENTPDNHENVETHLGYSNTASDLFAKYVKL